MAQIAKPLIHIIGLILIAMLVVFWIASIILLFFGQPYADFFFEGSNSATFLGTFNILFILGIPLLMLVLFIMRVFLKSNFRPKWQFGLWAFWLINVISLSMIGVSTFQDYQYGEEVKVNDQSFEFPYDTLRVEMESSPFGNSWHPFGDNALVSDDQLFIRNVIVVFEKSPSGRLEVLQRNEAKGGSLSEAERNASSIEFNYQLEGDKLILPAYTTINRGDKFRWQQVYFFVLVPEGMYVTRNREVSRNIGWVDKAGGYNWPGSWNNNYVWQMGANGMIAPEYISNRNKEFNLNGFSKIRVDGDIELTLKQGRSTKIVLDASDNQNEVEVTKRNERLHISAPQDSRDKYRMEITAPKLEELWVIQSGNIDIKDFKLEKLKIVNEGRARINAFADIKNLDLHLTGDNEMNIRGEGEMLNVILTDDAKLDAEHFTVKKAKLELDDSGMAKVAVTDTLWKNSMDSDITTLGTPVIIYQQEKVLESEKMQENENEEQ